MLRFLLLTALFALAPGSSAQQPAFSPITLTTEDGGTIHADSYGSGARAVVLAHGGRFRKESWQKQAEALVASGFRVLAIDFRGFGKSTGPGDKDVYKAPVHLDVLAAVRYLRKNGAHTVAIIGASFGGGAAARALVEAEPGEIDRVVFLAGVSDFAPERMQGRKLFILAREDASGSGPRLPGFRAVFDKSPEPKEWMLLEGASHAQFLFETPQGDRVMREIIRFLSAP